MNSYTTLASARLILGDLFRSSDFLPYLNQACERIINSGLWKGVLGYAAFPTVDNYFTLPYPYLAVVGAQWFRAPVPVFGQFHDFIASGPGQPVVDQSPEGIVEDLGDGYPTQVDIPTEQSTLRIILNSNADTGLIWRIYGTDGAGNEIFGTTGAGYSATIDYNGGAGTVIPGMNFNSVTGIEVPVNATTGLSSMTAPWYLKAIAPDGTITQLGYYYPNEATPSYRRYRIGVTDATNSAVPNAVTVLCRRRFMPIIKETDWVIPGNIGALKFAMQAIDSESSKNPAQPLWDLCYATLNQELHAARGAARPEMNYEVLGGYAGFNNVF